jgi:hypothetical protein
MRTFKIIVLGQLVLTVVTAITYANTERGQSNELRRVVHEELGRLRYADPAKDLQVSMQKGDCRFVGLQGFTIYVPGLNEPDLERYRAKYGVNVIKGTSDAIETPEHAELIEVGRDYAEHYNHLLLQKIGSSSWQPGNCIPK